MKILLIIFFSMLLLVGCKMKNEEKIDSIFNDYNKPNLPGAAVMVVKNGGIIFVKGYGLANVEKNISVTDSTNFRLASVTKQFTAMSILILIEKNKLKFETTINDVFPKFPSFGKEITIKNLLQHTSGLIDYENLIPDSATVQVKDKDVLALLMKTDSTYFKPGSKHQYSNTGYAILAMIIEKISGETYRDFVRESIFKPLRMNNTVAFEKDINEVANRAYGYKITNFSTEFADQSMTSAVLGDGGIYSSINDLYKWDQALYTKKLINRKYLDESWTSGVTTNGDEFSYGFGWRLENYKNNKVVYHTGSTRGFRNIIYRVPDKHFSIIILTNCDEGSEFSTLELAHQIMDLYIY
jgi:CubicO group peptidase (beta-lactamase class C family)